jgi:hypothetical protein
VGRSRSFEHRCGRAATQFGAPARSRDIKTVSNMFNLRAKNDEKNTNIDLGFQKENAAILKTTGRPLARFYFD